MISQTKFKIGYKKILVRLNLGYKNYIGEKKRWLNLKFVINRKLYIGLITFFLFPRQEIRLGPGGL